jgi:hypothetical protein
MTRVHDPYGQRGGQGGDHIRPVHAELGDARRVRFLRHNAPIGAADSKSLQARTNTVDFWSQAEPNKDSLAVRLKPESRPYLAQLMRLLKNVDVRACRMKRHRCRQATNASADNCDPQHSHRLLSTALPPELPLPRVAASRVTPKDGCCWQE